MLNIEVHMGDIALAKERDNLTASGIGSCVVVILHDPKLKIGALAHAMLPRSASSPGATGRSARGTMYVDSAIDEMLKRIEAQGSKRMDLEGKIIGGANMFSSFKSDISRENVLSAEEKLKKEGIKVVGECVGGSQGRSVEFSVASGIVTVKTKF